MALVGTMAYPVRDSFQSYPQQFALYQGRPQPPQMDTTPPSLGVGSYVKYSPTSHHEVQHQQQTPTRSSPQSRASPASDDGIKPSLPPISNLLGLAKAERPMQKTTLPHSSDPAYPVPRSPQHHAYEQHENSLVTAHIPRDSSRSPSSALPPPPPPPPMRNDSVVEGTQSPSTISTGSSLSSHPYFAGSILHHGDTADPRSAHGQFLKSHSLPSQPAVAPYGVSRYTGSSFTHSPSAITNPSYYSPTTTTYPASNGMFQQRPLPSNFPPPVAPLVVQSTPGATTAGNPWEHHHYISPSSQASFPQSQDRYICPTCNKAFSRPSSLKIHSHSHTGEKPFRCPHAGCGKAFSVRSNMKRHERGCHTGMAGHVHSHAHIV